MTDKRAPGEGADNDDDGAFGGPTVRTPAPPSFESPPVIVQTIKKIQKDLPVRDTKVKPGVKDAAPSDTADDGNTVPNSGPVALGDPPVKCDPPPVSGQLLAYLGDPRPPRDWQEGKIGELLEEQNTTPIPGRPLALEPIPAQVSTLVVPAPPMAMVQTVVIPPLPPQVQMPTLVMGPVPVPSPVADMLTAPCAADNDPWVRLVQALQSFFDHHVPGAISVAATATSVASVQLDPGGSFGRDSLKIHVVNWQKWFELRSIITQDDVRKARQIPLDLKRAALLIWADMSRKLDGSIGCLHVEGDVSQAVICQLENGFASASAPVHQLESSAARWPLIAVVVLGILAVVGVVMVLV